MFNPPPNSDFPYRRLYSTFIVIILFLILTVIQVYAAKYPHIRTAALTYSLTDSIGADFVGRHYDLAINPGGSNYDIIKSVDPQTRCLRYLTISTYRDDDYQLLSTFCNERGYNYDSMFLWVENNTVCVEAVAPAGEPCEGDVSCSDPGQKLQYCGWNSFRTAPDFRRQEVWEFVIYKYLNLIGSQFDGAMEDEAVFYYHPQWNYYSTMMVYPLSPSKWVSGSSADINGWEGYSQDAIRDSLMHLKQQTWLPMLMDSLRAHNKLRFANPAAYGVLGSDVIEDVALTGTGDLLGEGMHLRPLGGYWNNQAWDIMEYIRNTDGYAIVWTEITSADSEALGSWARCQMERLAWYYMVGDTTHFYFLLTGNELWLRPNDYRAPDSLYKWAPAFEYDIGQPVGSKYIAQTGTDPSGQSYEIYARVFTNGLVLHRDAMGSDYSANSAVSCNLGDQFYELQADGSLGDIVTVSVIKNCEGKIYIPVSGNSNHPPSAPDPLHPQYGENIEDTHPILIVDNSSDEDGDELTYNFYVALDSEFNQIVDSEQDIQQGDDSTSCPVQVDLSYGTDYYWRSCAFDGIDYGDYSQTSYFHIIQPNTPPPPPLPYIPIDGSTVDVTKPTLKGICSRDPDGDILFYFFEISADSQFTGEVLNGDSIKAVNGLVGWNIPIELNRNTTYFWRCRAFDGTDFGDFSSTSKFKVNGYYTQLDSVHLNSAGSLSPKTISPSNGAVINNNAPTLRIINIPEARRYYFRVALDTAFEKTIAQSPAIPSGDDKITEWPIDRSLPSGKLYYWQAKAEDGEWSGDDSFFVSIGIHIFPNPFRSSKGHRTVTFRNIPKNSHLKIATISGKTVREFDRLPEGDFVWDLRNASGDVLAPGVYLYLVDYPGGSAKGKLVIIR